MAAKWNNQEYYYTDPVYQLELDLQDIRRSLVYLLDEPDTEECFICNRLRCQCIDSLPSHSSSPYMDRYTDSISELDYSYMSALGSDSSDFDCLGMPPNASSSFELEYVDITTDIGSLPTPPPASTLPTPPWKGQTVEDLKLQEFYEDLLKWVQVSQPNVTEGGPNMKFSIDESINNEINLSWPADPRSIWFQPKTEYSRTKTLFNFYRMYTASYFNENMNAQKMYDEFFA